MLSAAAAARQSLRCLSCVVIWCILILISTPSGQINSYRLVSLRAVARPGSNLFLGQRRIPSDGDRRSTKKKSDSSSLSSDSSNAVSVNNNKNEKWDVLLQKLHRQKGTVEQFGKIRPNQGKEVDELKCIHFDECSGCSTKGNFTDTPTMIRARNVMRAHDVPFSIQIGNVTQWRTLAKIAVQPMSKWGGLKFGLYKRGSHDVVPIPECRIHHPRINEAVEIIRFAALTTGIKAYQPPHSPSAKSTGDLRYLQLVVERYSKKVQLVLVWNAANFKSISSLVSASKFLKLLRHRPDIFHSIHLNFHAGDNNVIFHQTPKAWTHIFGPPFIREKIGRATFYLRPQVFRQANIDFFERKVVPFVRKFVPEGCRAAELYAGLGVIGLNIADLTHELLLSDSNPFVGDVFDKCADSLPAEEKFRVFFDCLDADEAVEQGQCKNADLLIVDPPRKGLTPGVLQLITGKHEKVEAKKLRRVIYIGCGFDAVERDMKEILSSGKWTLRAAEGFALFPGSDHIETVLVFDSTTHSH